MGLDAHDVARLPLFGGLSPESAEWVASRLDDRHVVAGEHLTNQAASGYTFFVIVNGNAAVLAGDEEIARLGPGEFFGEAAIVGRTGRRNASVVADTPMRLAAMFGTDFRLMEQELPDVAARIRETMDARTAQ